MIDKYMEIDDLWDYAKTHLSQLIGDPFLVADEPEEGVELYLSAQPGENRVVPYLMISVDGDEIDSRFVFSKQEMTNAANSFIDGYMRDKTTLRDYFFGNTEENMTEDEKIEDREQDLSDAVEEFLDIALDDGMNKYPKEVVEDIKDHFLEYIARKHGLKVHRPMYLEYEDGVEYEEYPYANMEFDDEDNPIYRKEAG